RDGNRVRDHDLLERGGLDAGDGRAGQHGVNAAGQDALGAFALERAHRLDQGAGAVEHVVDLDLFLFVPVTDQVHAGGDVRPLAPLVDDGQPRVQALGDGARALHAARVGRYDHRGLQVLLAEVVDDDRRPREQVIDRDVEEPLDLPGVQ